MSATRTTKRRLTVLLIALALLAQPGCYYGHLAVGQTRLLLARRNIEQVLADPETPAALRHQLELVEATRQYARELGLEVGGQYTSYVAWPGDRIVTSIAATEPGSIRPANFRFPIVGSVPYKGFFDLARAQTEAESLRSRGLDVCVVPVSAYSTLGWLDDPITEPMLRRSDGELVEVVLHELVHATVFLKSQPSFNEGAASFIGEEAAVRFFAARDSDAATRQRARIDDDRLLSAAILELRDQIARLYESDSDSAADERERLEAAGRQQIAMLQMQSRDASQLAAKLRLNDACLALQGTYTGDTARHERLLESLGNDLSAYLQRFRAAAEASDPHTHFFGDSDELSWQIDQSASSQVP